MRRPHETGVAPRRDAAEKPAGAHCHHGAARDSRGQVYGFGAGRRLYQNAAAALPVTVVMEKKSKGRIVGRGSSSATLPKKCRGNPQPKTPMTRELWLQAKLIGPGRKVVRHF